MSRAKINMVEMLWEKKKSAFNEVIEDFIQDPLFKICLHINLL